MKTYELSLFECECGYYTTKSSNALRHAKSVACRDKTMANETKKLIDEEFASCDDISHKLKIETELKEKELLLVEKDNIIKRQKKAICVLSEKMPLDEDEDDEIGSGIIYYITDKDMPSRGKIGRTKNTDIKKLKCRYSTFSKPCVFCFYSTDIKKDENDLKTVLKENGCMDATIGKETVHNSPDTMRIFHEFANR
ncbi:protein of unknown function (DUF1390) [Paramecium bursaria Chlorella virus Fr5L]|nr:protein of unknown function (DUF1390) [Paramecium bursaria Chlorella virus Fr5L]